jgi:ATPase subunit of ABC transporter with duplicated ATPase domains
MHTKLMQEQHRAARSSAKGAKSINNKKWATVVSHAKARRAQETSGKKKIALQSQKQLILDQLEDLNAPPPIKPTFCMPAQSASGVLLQINNGRIGYGGKTVLSNIYLAMHNQDKVVLTGANGSGKTTLLKAIRQDASVQRTGEWQDLSPQTIGYLDQHYQQLPKGVTVLEALAAMMPDWDATHYYRHLADFLFKGHGCVNQRIESLSGGEKARLSLALIAAKPPKLLILDEVTNNVDLETIDYLIQILADYPGAMLIISHNQYFVEQLPITKCVELREGKFFEV